MGKEQEAQEAMSELLQLQPELSTSYVDTTYPFKERSDRDLFVRGLRLAGLRT